MYKIKSFFASSFILFSSIGTLYALYIFFQHETQSVWLTTAIAIGTGAVFFTMIMVRHTPTTSRYLLPYFVVNLLATCLTIFLFFSDSASALALTLSIISSIGWCLYIFWYSDLSLRDKDQLAVGHVLDDLSFVDTGGNPIKLSTLPKGKKILLFYRGNWCPFCVAQIKDLAAAYAKIKSLDTQVLFISPQHAGHTKKLARSLGIDAQFLIDKDLKVARELKIFHQHGVPMGMEMLGYDSDTVMPTVLIVNASNEIIYSDLTDVYRMRPDPQSFLEILSQYRD